MTNRRFGLAQRDALYVLLDGLRRWAAANPNGSLDTWEAMAARAS